jgi:hypothetical protein
MASSLFVGKAHCSISLSSLIGFIAGRAVSLASRRRYTPIAGIGIRYMLTTPVAPWQNGFVE